MLAEGAERKGSEGQPVACGQADRARAAEGAGKHRLGYEAWSLRFRQWEFPVLSPIATSFSDPTPTSLHPSASVVPRPAQTCPGLATAVLCPCREMQSCCEWGTVGASWSCPAATSGPHDPQTPLCLQLHLGCVPGWTAPTPHPSPGLSPPGPAEDAAQVFGKQARGGLVMEPRGQGKYFLLRAETGTGQDT